MTTLLNIFRQAWLNAPLSPAERGLLRAVKSAAVSALITGVMAAFAALSAGQVITWDMVAGAAFAVFSHSIVDAVAKYQAASAEVAQAAPVYTPLQPLQTATLAPAGQGGSPLPAPLPTPSAPSAPPDMTAVGADLSASTGAPIAPIAAS